jgi:hypothetical protein
MIDGYWSPDADVRSPMLWPILGKLNKFLTASKLTLPHHHLLRVRFKITRLTAHQV